MFLMVIIITEKLLEQMLFDQKSLFCKKIRYLNKHVTKATVSQVRYRPSQKSCDTPWCPPEFLLKLLNRRKRADSKIVVETTYFCVSLPNQ